MAYRDFMGWDVPWYSAKDFSGALLAGRWFGMQVCYLRHGERVFETYWASGRAAEALASTYALLDMTVYGRQEIWEDSPPDWPQPFGTRGDQFRTDGRPHRPMVAAGSRTLRRPGHRQHRHRKATVTHVPRERREHAGQ
jgi:Bacterial protein of unknown function (DUF899)